METLDKFLFEESVKVMVSEIKTNGMPKDMDGFYELANKSYRKVCDGYEAEHPEITEYNNDDTMWYDSFMDDGIINDIMCRVSEITDFAYIEN